MKNIFKIIALAFLALSLTGCILPKPPKWYTIEKTVRFGNYQNELHTIYQGHPSDRHDDRKVITILKRNALFIALDESVQPQFENQLMDIYKSDKVIRLEDVTWWRFAKKFNGLYDKVVRVPWSSFNKESFMEAISKLESLGKSYDIYLLTHGLPNHITTTKGAPFIGYKDIAELKGNLKRLDMVYMQGCFSNTLAADFLKVGAKSVLSFEGWNRNFFFVDFFIKRLERYNHNSLKAYEETKDHIKRDLNLSLLYRKLLDELGMSVEEYLENSPAPIYSSLK